MNFEICLNNLQFYAFHGVMDHERETGNEFIVNLSVKIPVNAETAAADDLNFTISYEELYRLVEEEMKKPRRLLETVAFDIASAIKAKYPEVTEGKFSVEKKRPPIPGMIGSASVSIEF